jgi:hypothetical protein
MVVKRKSAPKIAMAAPENIPTTASIVFARFFDNEHKAPAFPIMVATTTTDIVAAIPMEIEAVNSNPRGVASMDMQNAITINTAGHGTKPAAMAHGKRPFRDVFPGIVSGSGDETKNEA